MPLVDSYGRAIRDLRISITDRCNYRCAYCRTGTNGAQFAELPLQDYLLAARVFVGLGITKIRLTGGEPLLRKGIVDLVGELAKLRSCADPASAMDRQIWGTGTESGSSSHKPELAITTNGHLLAAMAEELKQAGLDRVTVSMDAVDPERFARITRVRDGYAAVLEGLREARRQGLGPVKVNCVLLRGFNEDQIEAFGRFACEEQVIVRFIEFMPLDEGRAWTPQAVVPLSEVLQRMARFAPFEEIAHDPSSTSRRYRFLDGSAEFGVIAPVTLPFCGACSRIRLTSDGKIRTCLFSLREHDLAAAIRSGDETEIARVIEYAVVHKEQRHHIGEPGFVQPGRTMVHIGG
jgi:cyclic pyranopterin phosphate synthase